MSAPVVLLPCANCGIPPPDKPFKLCPCRTNTAYCSVACQKEHRKEHKKKCVILREAKLGDTADEEIFGVLDQMRRAGIPVRAFTAAEVDGIKEDGDRNRGKDATALKIEDALSKFCFRCGLKIPPADVTYTIRYQGEKHETCKNCMDDWLDNGHLYKPPEERDY